MAARRILKEFQGDTQEHHYERWLNISGTFRRPDLILVLEERVFLFEFKLSFREEGYHQMLDSYAPPLAAIFGRPVLCTLVCKHLRGDNGPVLRLLSDLRGQACEGPFLYHEPGLGGAL